ncbi:ankyrin repeat domain-containing protein SOWAHC-like [Neolamprologus brichardi]|uniref:ankyrin repeat domain-containing protein SOWAHC-like n=1 Tax=Neolamprologus brichardi TaxID=32507 RepID=UPI00164377E5|nr:ankyrin repeat domain-containing protein SOWAHC-like [Neolamprologus brichardi]
MGNWESFRRDNRESRKEPVGKEPDVPEITVTEASPLAPERSFFSAPGPAHTGRTGQDSSGTAMGNWESFRRDNRESRKEPVGKEPDVPEITVTDASPLAPERSFFSAPGPAHTGRTGQERVDTHSLSGSDDNSTPRGSRKHFIEVMMNSSPGIRRSFYLSPRAEADSTSMVSSTLDEDRTAVALEPMEHEWMMCASDGQWSSLHHLLTAEPSLLLKKDFVTGFTCLHWAAKHGRPELIAMIINFAKLHDISVSIDLRSSTGYTPLHIAAMHGHVEVVKLLVRTYNADVEIRDYSGRKACQYLTDNVSVEIRSIAGGCECSAGENAHPRDGRRWRISNMKPLSQLNSNDCASGDSEGQPREIPLWRKSSLSRMKPKLQKLRDRTSQIIHSTSFKDKEQQGGSKRASRSRAKSHFFGSDQC